MDNRKTRFIRIQEVVARTGLSKASVYKLMQMDQFPESINLGKRSVCWLESDIDKWMEKKINTEGKGK